MKTFRLKEHDLLEVMNMTNNIADDFFNDFITRVVNETMESLFTDEFFPMMVDMFDIKEEITPIIMSAIDKKYQMQME